MLKKLLKYEFVRIYKFLIIFYGLSLFFGFITKILFCFDNSLLMNIFAQITSGVTISMIFNILINNLMRLWVLFKHNLYGDESYLTHTLPVDKKTLYLSKFIVAITSLLTSFLVIALTLLVAYYSKENMMFLKNILLPLANIYDTSMLGLVSIIMFLVYLELANLLQIGFTGLILGHRHNKNKIAFSLLYSFVVYTFLQLIVLIAMFIVALFNPLVMNLFVSNEIVDLSSLKILIYTAIVVYTIGLGLISLLNCKFLSNGVDVE